MGLDLAELFMDIEDSFGISIPENEPMVGTVGELIALVERLLDNDLPRACYSGHCFLLLRDVLIQNTECDRKQLRPSTPLSSLRCAPNSTYLYRIIREKLQARLPLPLPESECTLQRPKSIPAQIACILAFGFVGGSVFYHIPWWGGVGGSLLLIIFAEWFEFRANRPESIFHRAARFPAHCITLGDVAVFLSAYLSPAAMDHKNPIATEVAKRIKCIVSCYANVPPEQIKDNDHLVNDLGLD